jgi:hypothetical protein
VFTDEIQYKAFLLHEAITKLDAEIANATSDEDRMDEVSSNVCTC